MSEMMWGGRFQKAEERSALDFNASVSYDCRMYKEDIAGSLAHASMLCLLYTSPSPRDCS